MKYEIQDLKEIFADLREDYKTLRTKQKEWMSYIDRTFKTGLDENAYDHQVKLPTAMWIVESPVNYLALDNIRVKQKPKPKDPNANVTMPAQKNADTVEGFCQSLLDSWSNIPDYFYRSALKHLCRRGEASYKITVAPEIVRGDKDFKGIPFKIESVNPLYIMSFDDYDEFGCPSLLFRESIIYVAELKRLAEKWNTKEVKIKGDWKLRDKVLLLEWWSPEQRGYLAGPENSDIIQDTNWDAVLYQDNTVSENPYGFVPYTIGSSGLGEQSEDNKPEKRALSLLDGLEDAIKQQARNHTRLDTLSGFLTWPEEKYILSGADVSIKQEDLARKPGQPVVETPTKKHEWGPPRQLPPSLLQENSLVDAIFERYQPSVVRGAPVPGEPATSVANRHDWATQNLWEGIHLSSKHMIICALSMCLKTIDNLDLSVTWGGIRVNKAMINNYYALDISVRSGNQEEERWKHADGKGLWGFLSPIDIHEGYFGKENGTRSVKELFAWRLVESILTNLQNPIGQSIIPMIADALKLKLLNSGVISQTGQAANPMVRQEGSPEVNGSRTKGITPLTNRQPVGDENMQRFIEMMNTRAGG